MFHDELALLVEAGHGGSGSRSLRREKYIEFGGPDGGDGGQGGSVIIRVNRQLHTLKHLNKLHHIKAQNGGNGRGKKSHGRAGEDKIIEVPLGTIVTDRDTNTILVDLDHADMSYTLAHGGLGGKGNVHFRSALLQTPRYAQAGMPGEKRSVKLELKILADVGLVGCPNVGKSSLLAALSRSATRVADYPFTTLVPHLGFVALEDYNSFVMADIPGLIEGAHCGLGLGVRFLKHVERCGVLLLVIDVSVGDPVKQCRVLMHELKSYDCMLVEKTLALVLNKVDLLTADARKLLSQDFQSFLARNARGKEISLFWVSARSAEGLDVLKSRVYAMLCARENLHCV